jgi:parallel beta-helix repeat protein
MPKKIRKRQDGNGGEVEQVVLHVDKDGDFRSIGDAVKAAEPKTKILVGPHTYDETVIIDKPDLDIEGVPGAELVCRDADTLCFRTDSGVIRGLTIRHIGKQDRYVPVRIFSGNLRIELCRIMGGYSDGIVIEKGADPVISRNSIWNCMHGIRILEGGPGGLIEENIICENRENGIDVGAEASSLIRRNKIYDCETAGIFLRVGAKGSIEDNDIFRNEWFGIAVLENANPFIRRNNIYSCLTGIRVFVLGSGTIEANHLFDNEESGMRVEYGAEPTVRFNRIHDCHNGLSLLGNGVFEYNDIYKNRQSGVDIDMGASPVLRGNSITLNLEGISSKACVECDLDDNYVMYNERGNFVIVKGCESAFCC